VRDVTLLIHRISTGYSQDIHRLASTVFSANIRENNRKNQRANGKPHGQERVERVS
jgi:hypothetical protein